MKLSVQSLAIFLVAPRAAYKGSSMTPARPQTRNGFHIAIICALQIEFEAVYALLDDTYETDGFSYGKAAGDQNAYITGAMSKHHVVVVSMPGMGKARAATVAADTRKSFKSIQLALVVGICGGAPNTAEGIEIFLGDVIISTSIVQIDFGRQYPGEFITKGTEEGNLPPPRPEILSFLNLVSGRRLRRMLEAKTASFTLELYQSPELQDSKHPGIDKDELYPKEYPHRHRTHCSTCQDPKAPVCDLAIRASCQELGCDRRFLIQRDRIRNAERPAVHFGRIASGDAVIKSAEHRENLGSKKQIIAFEMESAGVWENLPTLVVKAVCDYADSHKTKLWQGYAAITSAACVKTLLENWRATEETEAESIQHIELGEATDKERLDCLHSLSFAAIDARQHNIQFAHGNTCDWLLNTQHFQRWWDRIDVEEFNGVLWIKGKPGAGKSTLMKHLLIHCQRTSSTRNIAAYFFNARGDGLEKSSQGMLQSLLYQLLDQNKSSDIWINVLRPYR